MSAHSHANTHSDTQAHTHTTSYNESAVCARFDNRRFAPPPTTVIHLFEHSNALIKRMNAHHTRIKNRTLRDGHGKIMLHVFGLSSRAYRSDYTLYLGFMIYSG